MSDTFDAASWVDAAIRAGMEPWAVVTHENRHLWTKEIDIDRALEPPRLATPEECRAVLDELIRRGRVNFVENLVGGAHSG
jgi:hypothetical protein